MVSDLFFTKNKLALEQRSGKILVVDDQPVNIQVIYQLLAGEHELFVATSGEQALEFCRQSPPDLVLLDVVMPGMNGLEVCRELKKDPVCSMVPVIFVTGHNDQDEENACWQAGGVDFITKPVNGITLRHRVRAHLTLKFQADLLQKLAMMDGLTGVANRRLFDETFKQEWRRVVRAGNSISLLLLDIDHFKAYNDHYGHQAGDECLKAVAEKMSEVFQRPGDLLARYGGEEFAAVLPDTDISSAYQLSERIQTEIESLNIPHESSSFGRVTASIGIACWSGEENMQQQDLFQIADKNLYQAKNAGRCCIYPTISELERQV